MPSPSVSYYQTPHTFVGDPVNTTYRTLVHDVLCSGQPLFTRNANRTRLHNVVIRFDTFPLVTVRRTAWKTALREMEWFLNGGPIHESIRKWWEPWLEPDGNIAYGYGEQFRHAVSTTRTDISTFDQIEYLINGVKEHPFSTRNLITTWNTGEMAQPDCKITNCHGTVIQVFGRDSGTSTPIIDMTMYQRSADLILGVPHNWVQYRAFMHWLAHRTGCLVGSFTWIGGDVHIYESHLEVAKKIMNVNYCNPTPPQLTYKASSAEFRADDFTVAGEFPPAVTDEVGMVV